MKVVLAFVLMWTPPARQRTLQGLAAGGFEANHKGDSRGAQVAGEI